MRGSVAKKLRKEVKQHYKVLWFEYLKDIKQWPFGARWKFCWYILFGG